jgi:hypothetical protein
MIRRSLFYVAQADGQYIVERYVRGGREAEGPFATRALAQAKADELNSDGPMADQEDAKGRK